MTICDGYVFSCYFHDYPCGKYDGADLKDSFITHKNQLADNEKVKYIGIEAYKDGLNTKIEILVKLLRDYDDGRRKGVYSFDETCYSCVKSHQY